MRYLGGKSKLAKEIAQVIAPKGIWWEPFCGGLSVSVQLAKYGPGLVSDTCLPLISLYQAVQAGWVPPDSVTEAEYRQAKSLPDTDPLKAFIGFGCSFGGKWFGGLARSNAGQNYVQNARNSLLRDVPQLGVIGNLNFLDVQPEASQVTECIYADPPYAGTTGYKGVTQFNHMKFWARCQQWSALGVRVFVSEYACPVPHKVVWAKVHQVLAQGGKRGTSQEYLFQVK